MNRYKENQKYVEIGGNEDIESNSGENIHKQICGVA